MQQLELQNDLQVTQDIIEIIYKYSNETLSD